MEQSVGLVSLSSHLKSDHGNLNSVSKITQNGLFLDDIVRYESISFLVLWTIHRPFSFTSDRQSLVNNEPTLYSFSLIYVGLSSPDISFFRRKRDLTHRYQFHGEIYWRHEAPRAFLQRAFLALSPSTTRFQRYPIISWGTIIMSSNPTFVSNTSIFYSPRVIYDVRFFGPLPTRLAGLQLTNPVIISPRIIIQRGRGECLSHHAPWTSVPVLRRNASRDPFFFLDTA